MIPDEAWRFLQRWLWLLVLAIASGGVLGVMFLPKLLGDGGNYTASTVLSVGRFASPAGVVTATADPDQNEMLRDYTQALADATRTPRFIAQVRERALARGLDLTAAAINAKVKVEAQPSLFIITVEATDRRPEVAEGLASAMAEAISAEAQLREQQLRQSLAQRAEQGQEQLMARLQANRDRTLARLQALNASALQSALAVVASSPIGPDTGRRLVAELARLSGDPELVMLDAEASALHRALTDLASAREAVEVALSSSNGPFFVLQPVQTVQEQPLHAVRTRDALVLGAGAGLVAGWLSASLADHLLGRMRRRNGHED